MKSANDSSVYADNIIIILLIYHLIGHKTFLFIIMMLYHPLYLQVGEVISIPVQRSHLSWSNVLLVVGPMWCLYVNKDVCAQMLCETFKNVLNYAGHVLKLKSLAMPAISTGVYICVRALFLMHTIQVLYC